MQRRRTLCTRAFVRMCTVGVFATVVGAQDQPRPTFRTEANYVRIDVYATRDGLPVTDLRQEDFEVLEEKAPQRIEQFEYIAIRSAAPQEPRREVNTVAESRQVAADARARVFVLFLDTNHVEGDASRNVQRPLVDALNRLIGPDDVIAVMTPEMSGRDVTFARKTTTIEEFLARYWWGGRDRITLKDPTEERYAACYPGIPLPGTSTAPDQGIAQEMILRRREKQTLDAVENLVRFLRGVREERKAIVTISDGWRLFPPNLSLARPLPDAVPGATNVGIDPRTGRLGTNAPSGLGSNNRRECEGDRLTLAQIDDHLQFRNILDEANRANASFYPIDPRGLVVFDEQIVPSAGVGIGRNANPTVPPTEDQARLTARNTSLRTLAEATDGMAVVSTNDLARGLRRMADDLSSYYLLGYYSTGKLDGKFHSITVRVKRQGVQVRARRGYLAPTAAEVAALTTLVTRPAVSTIAAAAEARAVEAAVGSLAAFARELPMRLQVVAGWTPAGAATVWTVAEVGHGAGSDDWTGGGQVDATLVDGSGATVATGRTQIAPGASSVRIALTSNTLAPGDYQIRIRTKGAGTFAAANDAMQIAVPAAPNANGALFIRRGPTTGNKDAPTADPRFRRSDRLRVEVPTPSSDAVGARLLDRTGRALPIPVAGSVRDDAEGFRWQSAELALAPLAPGDYIIELAVGTGRTLVAFRVIP